MTSARGFRFPLVLGLAAILLIGAVGCDRSASEWEAARLARSEEAIKGFVEKHAASKQIEEARALLAVVQLEAAKWQEAEKAGSLPALHAYASAFPDSRFRSIAEERKARSVAAFKPDNVLIIIKAPDGSGTLLGVWHGPVEFALSGNFMVNFVPPDPKQKRIAIAVLEGTDFVPPLEVGHAYIWLGGKDFIRWRPLPATPTQATVAASFGMPEGGSRVIVVPEDWMQRKSP